MFEQRQSTETGIAAKQSPEERDYWLKQMAGHWTRSRFHYDHQPRKNQEYKPGTVLFTLTGEPFERLMKLVKGSDAKLHMVLLAELVLLLGKYGDSSDIMVGSPIYRQKVEGEFINTILPLRNRLTGTMTFKDLLFQVRETLHQAVKHQNYPMDKLIYQLDLAAPDNRFPLFEVALLLENIHEKQYIAHIPCSMMFSFMRTDDSVSGRLEYDRSLYDNSTVERITDHFCHLVGNTLFNPDMQLSKVDVLTEEERKRLLWDFNNTGAPCPINKTLHGLFTDQVGQTPDRVGQEGRKLQNTKYKLQTNYKSQITNYNEGDSQQGEFSVFEDNVLLTYKELDRRSDRLALLLREKGVMPGTIVGITEEPCIELAIETIAVLKAGGAYMPLDPGFPGDRLDYMKNDANVKILVKEGKVIGGLNGVEDGAEGCGHGERQFPAAVGGVHGELAYVIYTSGSTGKPRGVLIEHGSILNYALWRIREYRQTPADISLQLVSFSFDGFCANFYPALLSGGRVVFIGQDKWRETGYIRWVINKECVTNFSVVPSMYRVLLDGATEEDFKCLRFIVLAGEKTDEGLIERSQQLLPHIELINEYGPTENAVTTACHRGMTPVNTSVIGKPISNHRVFVLDEYQHPRPVGVPGELYVTGAGLTRGYLNRPGLTCASFINSGFPPLSVRVKLYRTGDMVRWLVDGTLEILGRIDNQVQIRGFRIELEEIENYLWAYPEIQQAAVVVKEAKSKSVSGSELEYNFLCAYIVGGNDEIEAIRKYLAEKLPDYMVPTYILRINQMPLMPNGKINRQQLAKMEISPDQDATSQYVAPRNEIESKLARIWSEFLEREQVGITDNFFSIGGDSIKTIGLLNLINKEYNRTFELVDLYENETIEKFARKIESEAGKVSRTRYGDIRREIRELKQRILADENYPWPREIEDIYPMSDIETGMIYYTLRDIVSPVYYNQVIYQLEHRDFDERVFKRAFALLAQKHAILRTAFNMGDFEMPVQVVYKEIPFDTVIMNEDISHLDRQEQEAHINMILEKDRTQPVDIKLPESLWRVKTFLIDEESVIFIWIGHHALIDGWSSASLATELNNIYLELKTNPDFQPGKLKSTYKDFVIEQMVEKQNTEITAYWQRELEDYRRLKFPGSSQSPGEPGEINIHMLNLDVRLLDGLKEVSRRSAAPVKSLCFAAYVYMLSMLSYENDIVVGLVTNNRPNCEDGDKMIGCFLNTIPFRLKIPAPITCTDYIKLVDKKMVELKRYDRLSLFEIVRLIGEKTRTENPLFDAAFNFVDFHIYQQLRPHDSAEEGESGGGGSRQLMIEGAGSVNTLFNFDVNITEGQFLISFFYSTAIIEEELAMNCLVFYENLLKKFIHEPDGLLEKVTLLSPAEKQKLLEEFNSSHAGYPLDKTLHELFAQQVERTPDKIACVGNSSVENFSIRENPAIRVAAVHGAGSQTLPISISYKELNQRCNQLAHVLIKRGIRPDTIAGIMMERSIEMIIGILGILKAGGAYMPINPDGPVDLITGMLEDSQAPVLLTNAEIQKKYSFTLIQGLQSPGVEPIVTPARAPVTNLDDLPIPDRSLVDYEKYNQYIGHTLVQDCISIQATRGCPFNCAYCHKIWPKHHLVRSANSIFAELQLNYNLGVRRFSFVDDIFNFNVKNSRRFFELVIENQLDLQLFSMMRGDILTHDYIDLMIEAGVVRIALALETASPRMQKFIGKNLNIEKLRQNIEYIAGKYPRVILELYTMHGFPTETREEAMMTMDFIKSIRWLDFPYIFILTIYPNTDMEELAIKSGISAEAIKRSFNRAYHELPETLPFDRSFTMQYQADFLDNYFLSRERLLKKLPFQMKVLTEGELVQKYNTYLPVEMNSLEDLLGFFKITRQDLGKGDCLEKGRVFVPDLNSKYCQAFPGFPPEPHEDGEDALKILLLDLSQEFGSDSNRLNDMVEAPLGLMYLLTGLKRQYGKKINGKIAKSLIDFNNFEELRQLIEEFKPGLIGIRTLTYFMDFFHRTAAMIRQWGISAPIITGGPYATSGYRTLLKDRNIDLVVLGEGEVTFNELVGKIIDNNGQLPGPEVLEKIPGLAFMPDQGVEAGSISGCEILMMDVMDRHLSKQVGGNPGLRHHPGNLAYVMYTSGSAGRPKGVMVGHGNAVNVVSWFGRQYLMNSKNSDTHVLQMSDYLFDPSVNQIFGTFLHGGVLYLITKQLLTDIVNLRETIKRHDIQVINFVPGLIRELLSREKLDSLTAVISGAEKLEDRVKNNIIARGYNLYNQYGPTEATIDALCLECTSSNVTLGKPIANVQCYILDSNQDLLPIGVPGELTITGAGITRGYLNNPRLTSVKFINNKKLLQGVQGGGFLEKSPPGRRRQKQNRAYSTGDLARWLRDGNIGFLGRIDRQIKIMGYRVELEEIENRLQEHKQIKEVVVLAIESQQHPEGSTHLGAYVVFRPSGERGEQYPTVEQLERYLSRYIPAYMIPASFMILDSLPMTPGGKIDRGKLREAAIGASGGSAPPRSRTERKLAGVWREVLGLAGDIGIDDNFFDLGGHSLKATIMVSKIHSELNIKIPLAELFNRKTIRGLSEYIQRAKAEKYTGIEPVEKREYYALSSAQKRLYFLQQMDIGSISYNMPLIMPVGKEITGGRLENIMRMLVHRHESLRTSFITVEDEPVQKVHEIGKVEFKIQNDHSAGKDIIKSFIRPFDLAEVPLIRSALITHPDRTQTWVIDMHHIISDGTSHAVLTEDFISLFNGEESAPLRLHYKDFSQWQNALFRQGVIDAQEQYWLDLYGNTADLPRLQLPADYKRPEVFTFTGDLYDFMLEREDAVAFKALAAGQGSTIYMNILAVLNVLFYNYTGQRDIIIGTGIAGRPHADLQRIIGMFVNTLAMRNYPGGDKTYLSFLDEVVANSVMAFENQDFQFEELVDRLEPQRDPSRNPLFDISMVVQNFNPAGAIKDSAFTGERGSAFDIQYKSRTARFDMTFFILEQGENIFITIEYYTGIFKQETIRRLAAHFCKIVNTIIKQPAIELRDIEIITAGKKKQILYEFNDTDREYARDKTIPELFAEQVNRTPHSTAVTGSGFCAGSPGATTKSPGLNNERITLTYRELNKKAHQLAHYFYREKNVNPGDRIGVLMNRSVDLIATILGILQAGGAYVPLNPSLPPERVKYIIDDSGINIIVSEKRCVKKLNQWQWECNSLHSYLCLDSQDIGEEDETEENELMAKDLWDHVGETARDDITGGGWTSSFTGQPLSKAEMDEYGNNILLKLQPLLHPRMRVLEIGCASGISMYRIAPKVAQYYGTDLSPVIIDLNKQKVKQENIKNITLSCLPAHEIHQLKEKDFDLIIMNSVIQCFHGHNYLKKVIRQCMKLLGPLGLVFIGDIMDQDKKNDLVRELLEFKHASKNNKNQAYKTKTDFSPELFIPRSFFKDLEIEVEEIETIECSDKIYTIENELTTSRYDALVKVNKQNRHSNKHKSKKRKHQDDYKTISSCQPISPLPPGIKPASLAYLIYTSGTTGKPKGAMINHQGIANLNSIFTRDFQINSNDNIAQFANISFDASIWEIFMALLNGATLHLVSKEIINDLYLFHEFMIANRISTITLPPPYAHHLEVEKMSHLRLMITAGSSPNIDFIKKCIPYFEYVNAYGPTEVTICGSFWRSTHNSVPLSVSIGKPVCNTKIYILNENHLMQPPGITGEIYISGAGLSRGYLNNPEMTAEKFCLRQPGGSFYKNHPLDPRKNFLLNYPIYKTGDMGHWMLDGNIEFLGRIDQQVKIRGYRIELEEIENQLMKHSGINDAVVAIKSLNSSFDANKVSEDGFLCAYIVNSDRVGEELVDYSSLKEFLAQSLPDYMIPTRFTTIEKIPLTNSGKVNRAALPLPEITESSQTPGPPLDDIEKKLLAVWSEVLNTRDSMINVHTNFFEIGGDSIKAIRTAAKLRNLGLKMEIRDLFLYPRVKELSKHIQKIHIDIPQEPIEGPIYLTPIQQWFFNQHTSHHHFNQPTMIFRKEGFDEKKLRSLFKKITQHHDALRIAFELQHDRIIQRNQGLDQDKDYFHLEVIPLQNTNPPDINKEIESHANHLQETIDLQTGPLVKLGLFKSTAGDYLLIIIHHLVVDGISWRILLEDISSGYRQLIEKETILFPSKTHSFQFWAHQLHLYSQSQALLNELDYWQTITGTDIQPLPRDTVITSPQMKYKNRENLPLSLDKINTKKLLTEIHEAYHTEINDILLVTLALAIKQWCGIEKIAVNLEGHGREEIIAGMDISRTVGWFTSQYPVVLDASNPDTKENPLASLIKQTKENLRRIPNKGIGFGILKYLTPPDKKQGARFHLEPEISFNYLGQFTGDAQDNVFQLSSLGTGQAISPETEKTNVLDINSAVVEDTFFLYFNYNQLEYQKENIRTLANAFHSNLLGIIRHCSGKEENEITPADLDYSDLSIEQLEDLENQLGQIDID